MANAKKCDRCKQYYEEIDTTAMPYHIKALDTEPRDLCPNCLYELEEFMDNFKGRNDILPK